MHKRLLFKIDYVCKIPWGGGGEQGHFCPAVYFCTEYTGKSPKFYDENASLQWNSRILEHAS